MSFWPRIILLGDSLTQYSLQPNGWGAAIAQQVQRKCDILNRGFSGYNTDNLLHYMDQIIDKEIVKNVAFFTLCMGANDSCYDGSYSKQHVPVERYEKNLCKIVQHLNDLGIKSSSIVLITPPPVEKEMRLQSMIEKEHGDKTEADRGNEHTVLYAKACLKVAEETGCRSVDLFGNMIEKDLRMLLNDGLHFSDKGCQFLATLLQPHVDELTKDLPVRYPDWKAINNIM